MVEKRRKPLVVLIIAAMFGTFIPVNAQILSDDHLAGIYAGDVNTGINDDIVVENSAVVNQKNIAAAGSLDSSARNTHMRNTNRVRVKNEGDSAIALQSNIAAIAGLGEGQTRGNVITNRNIARVKNTAGGDGSVDSISDGSASIDTQDASIFVTLFTSQSAVTAQGNIGIIAGGDELRSNRIHNTNRAVVDNTGDSGVALQSNSAVISGLGDGLMRNNLINNRNIAAVDNIAVSEGFVEGTSDDSASGNVGNNSAFTLFSASRSAVSSQSNIAAVAGGGSILNTRIINQNRAAISNLNAP